jgi:hypothetical protein
MEALPLSPSCKLTNAGFNYHRFWLPPTVNAVCKKKKFEKERCDSKLHGKRLLSSYLLQQLRGINTILVKHVITRTLISGTIGLMSKDFYVTPLFERDDTDRNQKTRNTIDES